MKLVDKPYAKPHRCAAIPFIGQSSRDTVWIDTGAEIDGFDNHVYLSDTAVYEAAKLLGLPSKGDHQLALDKVRELSERLTEVERELEEAQNLLGAIQKVKAAGLAVSTEDA